MKEEMKEVQQDAAEGWRIFKGDAEEKIKDTEARIAELKEKMKTSGKTMYKLYEAKIAALEERIQNLKTRMENYEANQSDWQSFKREFNHDMDELGKAFKDLTVDNKE